MSNVHLAIRIVEFVSDVFKILAAVAVWECSPFLETEFGVFTFRSVVFVVALVVVMLSSLLVAVHFERQFSLGTWVATPI